MHMLAALDLATGPLPDPRAQTRWIEFLDDL
jgi:hypothetical protein